MGGFPFFVFLFLNGNWETARFPILVFSFQNENPLAAKYTDRLDYLFSLKWYLGIVSFRSYFCSAKANNKNNHNT